MLLVNIGDPPWLLGINGKDKLHGKICLLLILNFKVPVGIETNISWGFFIYLGDTLNYGD